VEQFGEHEEGLRPVVDLHGGPDLLDAALVHHGDAVPRGFLVKTVAQGSMAWNMGLQGGDRVVVIGGKEVALGGDIILSVEDIPVVSEDNIEQIRNRLAGGAPGAPFKMSVLRAGKILELTGTSR
jgi:S1-C subfamily serine protease